MAESLRLLAIPPDALPATGTAGKHTGNESMRAHLMNPHGREVDSAEWAKGTFTYLSWPRRKAVARLARRIREDSIWIRRACLTQPDVQQATALRVAARSRRDFVARLAKDWPFPSARASSRHRSGQQRGSREVGKGAQRREERDVVIPPERRATPQRTRRVASCIGFGAQAWTDLLRALSAVIGVGVASASSSTLCARNAAHGG